MVDDGEGFAFVEIGFFVDQGDRGFWEVHEGLGVGAGENFFGGTKGIPLRFWNCCREVAPIVEFWCGLGELGEIGVGEGGDGEPGLGVVAVGDRLVACEEWVVGGDFWGGEGGGSTIGKLEVFAAGEGVVSEAFEGAGGDTGFLDGAEWREDPDKAIDDRESIIMNLLTNLLEPSQERSNDVH